MKPLLKLKQNPAQRFQVIYDVLYGFVPITEWEEKIINSPFFQRLRWIKQLGFSNYIFPGAEHNRFAHVIGVMHSMEQMLRALGIAVDEATLHDRKQKSQEVLLHRSLRIAALLHDIGTFPFSHAVEHAYIRHGNDDRRRPAGKDLPNSHEHLGSFIIKNTRYPGGLTRILEEYGFDVNLISKIIKGDSPWLVANQLMHSDLDADRMDYLIRDSHYTGIKYGQFDREYILANLAPFDAGKGQIGFGVRENALHAVDHFLIARFSWYSQIIKHQGSAKFDILSSHITEALLRKDLMYQFQDLLEMVERADERIYWWNDVYFMNRLQELNGTPEKLEPKVREQIRMLLFREPPRTVRHPIFQHRILERQNRGGKKDTELRFKELKQAREKVEELSAAIKKHGSGKEWLLADLPSKDVVFTRGLDEIIQNRNSEQILRERDPVKIVSKQGGVSLLVQRDNSLMQNLSGFSHFVPSLYGNESAVALLQAKKLIPLA